MNVGRLAVDYDTDASRLRARVCFSGVFSN
jgi:hypothetical protein